MIQISYNSETEKNDIISAKNSEGLILIEEMNVSEGNFLIFNDVVPSVVPTVEERVSALEDAMLLNLGL